MAIKTFSPLIVVQVPGAWVNWTSVLCKVLNLDFDGPYPFLSESRRIRTVLVVDKK